MRFLSVNEAAEELGISVSAVYELVSTGKVQHRRIGGRYRILSLSVHHIKQAREFEREARDVPVAEVEFVSAKQAADLTGLAHGTICRLCRSGDIDARKRGGMWEIDPVSLAERTGG